MPEQDSGPARPDHDLEREFSAKMEGLYGEAAVLGYRPTRYLQMVRRRGGLGAAKYLLHRYPNPEDLSPGLLRLAELGHPEISVEALIVSEPWRSLFTDEEVAIAQQRLARLGYRQGSVR